MDDQILVDVEPCGILYQGAVAPEALIVNAMNAPGAAAPLDYTTIVSAVMIVTDPKGNKRTWPCTVSAVTSGGATFTHVFNPDGKDLDTSGRWGAVVRAALMGGGVRRIMRVAWEVVAE